jgi:2,3-diaminopropionate biosynthesis protein SbnB
MSDFTVIGANFVNQWLVNNGGLLIDIVLDAYNKFHDGEAVNPDSYFLRFPDNPNTRIIALPASSESEPRAAGIKWISSFPSNIEHNLDRASAVFILNDRETGYPLACLEGSLISCYRTAASALVGANLLHPRPGIVEHMVVVGCGLISFTTVKLMLQTGWKINKLTLVDTSEQRSQSFARKIKSEISSLNTSSKLAGQDKIADIGEFAFSSSTSSIDDADMILFATSAIEPYCHDMQLLKRNPTILHMSLRDLGVELVLASQNIADDVDHAVKSNSSLHLAEQATGNRDFIAGNICQFSRKELTPNFNKARIFSPFGMGILDLLVANSIYRSANSTEQHEDSITRLDNFFPKPYVEEAVDVDEH